MDFRNEADTYELIKRASAVVTLNSQAGLEAAAVGKPVVIGASCFYSGLGFAREAFTRALMEPALRQLISEGAPPGVADARRFLYIYFRKFCRNKSGQALADLLVQPCNHWEAAGARD